MTRAPVLRLPSAKKAVELKLWLERPENHKLVTDAFEGTSRYAKLLDLKVSVAGRYAFARFKCFTGDAMGMVVIQYKQTIQKSNTYIHIIINSHMHMYDFRT